jgi:hypothetical protein
VYQETCSKAAPSPPEPQLVISLAWVCFSTLLPNLPYFSPLEAACARDYAIRKALNDPSYSVADYGFPTGVRIRAITDRHHASIEKAAAVVGIGRKNVVDLALTSINSSMSFSERLDDALASYSSEDTKTGIRTGFIVIVGFAEVNTVRLYRRGFLHTNAHFLG